MDSTLRPLAALLPLLLIPVACSDDGGADTTSSTETSTSGDGDGDSSSTETGTASGDGDGDMTTSGDGDGDPATGDGDGDGDATGDGDGDPAPPNCGDGQVDVLDGEQCDDGNTMDGDGCSANCQLELLGETCGDGNLDNLEICDDNNLANGDGCNPTCNLENTTTLEVGSPGVPGLIDGNGQMARLGGWCVLAADNDYLWVGDSLNQAHAVIRRYDIQTGDLITIAGGTPGDQTSGVGINARFQWVEAIATDGNTLWIADGGNHKIKAVDLQPPYAVTTVAGSGANQVVDGNGQNAAFSDIRGLTYYNGIVYSVDGSQSVLRSFDPQSGDVLTIAGMVGQQGQQDGVGGAARFISPRYMTSDNSGMLFIADTNGNKIRSYNTVDGFVGTFAGDGTSGYVDAIGPNARIHRPRGMTSDGTSVYIAEFNQHTIRQGVIADQSITTNIGQDCGGGGNCPGGYQEGTGVANTQLRNPVGLAFHYPSNTVFVCDSDNNVIRALR